VSTVPAISANRLLRHYKGFERREGLRGALLDLFSRRVTTVRALDDVSFSIAPGEMVGYIGANGAGKSTTIKMLTGILTPTSGTVSVHGLDPLKQRYANSRQTGVVFGQRTQLWWDLAVIEAFSLIQKIYEIPLPDYKARLDRFIEVLDISAQLHTPVRKLSLGQRMKCDLAASLLHGPRVLFLDEPTIGLDIAVKERVRRFIREMNREENVTVFLTTHDMTDIEELCDRIIMLDSGRMIFDGARTELLDRYGNRRRVVLDLAEGQGGADVLEALKAAASGTGANAGGMGAPPMASREGGMGAPPVAEDIRVKLVAGQRYTVSFDRRERTASEVIAGIMARFDVHDLALREPELGDIVRAIYEGKGLEG
jgi:ABC-2 type transport system ATP-binding protein